MEIQVKVKKVQTGTYTDENGATQPSYENKFYDMADIEIKSNFRLISLDEENDTATLEDLTPQNEI